MIIHTVRSPFMSREGQFEERKHTLVIGLDFNTVKSTKAFRCYIGKNKDVYYEIDSAEALRLADQYQSHWKNGKGKIVLILPVKDFKRVDTGPKEKVIKDARLKIDNKTNMRVVITEKQLSLI